MAKNLKFTIKNTQIAAAVNLSGLTEALHKKQEEPAPPTAPPAPSGARPLAQRKGKQDLSPEPKEERPRVRARARSAFSESHPAFVASEELSTDIEQKKAGEEHELPLFVDSQQEIASHEPSTAAHVAASTTSIAHQEERVLSSMQAPVSGHEIKKQEKPQEEKTEFSAPVSSRDSSVVHHAQPLVTETKERVAPPEGPSTPAAKPSHAIETIKEHGTSTTKAPKGALPYPPTSPTRALPSTRSRPPSSQSPPSRTGQFAGQARATSGVAPSRPAHTERFAERQRPPQLARPARSESTTQRPLVRNPALFSAGKNPPPSVAFAPAREKLGPTGKHVRDLIPSRPPRAAPSRVSTAPSRAAPLPTRNKEETAAAQAKQAPRTAAAPRGGEEDSRKGGSKTGRLKEFQDVKPVKRGGGASRSFDARDRQGLRSLEEESVWRKRRSKLNKTVESVAVVRPSSLHVRLPITVKELAAEMKIKASQVIEKIFLQGMVRTMNDFLDDATLVELIGQELGCELIIDTSEEDRIRITSQTVREEVAAASPQKLIVRPPIVAFMGHVDHGKTSLIDAIRKSNRVAGEAGAITQHIGAFQCTTPVGSITILDTPGHEAFSAMRARGADVTDIVVLVIAGDEGIRQQTLEAIEHAKSAHVTIVVAINKCDKPNFNAEMVYRQLAEHELLPEAWGGHILTINCSAVTGQGISELLEMLALQSEVLELRANPTERARGRVIESEMHKGMGSTATILVQNGTLRKGDALVFDQYWGRVKTMRNDLGLSLLEAPPSTPVEITGLSGLPEAGQEFIVVTSEREARDIAEKRMLDFQQHRLQQAKRVSLETLTQQASDSEKKILYLVLRADVQGSLEALQTSLKKIQSKKVLIHVISAGVGEISESDVQLAAMSKGVILGFHTGVESHAESMIRQTGVQVHLHDIIYHAVDDVKVLMAGLLDRIAVETEKGKAEVLELFHSSHMGLIAGCRVIEGSIMRQYPLRLRRGKDIVWQGTLASLKRGKEDAREVQKGIECGMVLQGCKEIEKGDIIEAYEITYITQEL